MGCTYDIGDIVRVKGVFQRKSDLALIDPATVKVRVRNPQRVITVYTYGVDAGVIRSATGTYYLDVTINKVGKWSYRWEGSGANQAAEEKTFEVRPSDFYRNSGEALS